MKDRNRSLGLDVGDRRIGLALSDIEGMLATPFKAIQRKALEQDIAAILAVVREEGVGCIVVGMPLSLSGGMGPQAERTIAFYDALKAASPVPVETWDERFSSVEAGRRLQEAGVAPSRNRERLDASAAAVILQSYLDSQRQRT